MSDEEKAIEADPLLGSQHGVILLEETLRDESETEVLLAHHLRAKVLSAEARSLGDLQIPFNAQKGKLKKFWARTIHPDGRVMELTDEDLEEQTIIRVGRLKVKVLKAVLRGVEPGCVVDYGYVIKGAPMDWSTTVHLQREWPVRELRYQWYPLLWLPSQWIVRRGPDIDLSIEKTGTSVLIEGRNLPLYVDEPWSPPDDLIRAGVTLFYQIERSYSEPSHFWDNVAYWKDADVEKFLKKDRPLKKALASIELPEGEDLTPRLEAVYYWIENNIRNTSLLTAAESSELLDEVLSGKWKKQAYATRPKDTAEHVLEHEEGSAGQMLRLFMGFARELGAQVDLVLAPDRDENLWEREVLAEWQLDGELAAVFPDRPGSKPIFVDPGWGLPFGTVRWWYTPTKALHVRDKAAHEIWIPHSQAQKNVLKTHATIEWTTDNMEAQVDWSATGAGQRGHLTRLSLYRTEQDKKQEELDELCGNQQDFEVVEASAPEYDNLQAPFRLKCKGTITSIFIDDLDQEFLFGFEGAWVPELPEFSSNERVHAVVLHYPFIDLSTLKVRSPAGFNPADPPDHVKFDGPFGSYGLKITKENEGFLIERAVAIQALTVKPEQYPEMRQFLERIRTADRTVLAFERSGGDQ